VLQLNTGSDGAVLTSYPVISIHHVTWLDGLMATMAGLIRDVSAVTWPRTWSVMLCYFGLSRILAAASKRRGGMTNYASQEMSWKKNNMGIHIIITTNSNEQK